LHRVPIQLGELMVSIKCGESDTTTGLASCPTVGVVVDRLVDAGATVLFGETPELTGGEHLIADRCVNDEVRDGFMELYRNYASTIEANGADLLGSQPTQGNIAGGLSTIEEKALGNIEKTGTKPVLGVLARGEAPPKERGLYFMDSSSAAAEHITLMCAGGAVLHMFPTGQGNVIGHPVEPVIKVTGNPHTALTMGEHIDLDVSGLLSRDLTLHTAGAQLMEVLRRTANGRLTCAETLGHREFSLTRLYPSA
jgi:(2R)-sulfolactate sulfo-lyase subunit beta